MVMKVTIWLCTQVWKRNLTHIQTQKCFAGSNPATATMRLKMKKDFKNPRYVGQRDGFSCGPISILNVLKWAGYDVTSKYLADLKRYCKTDKGGTDTKNITKVLQRYSKLKYQCVPFIKVQDLHNHIKNGGSAIVEISWFDKKKKETTGHYYAIVGILEYGNVVSYKAINWKIGFTQNFADRKAIVKEFRKCMKSEENPKAWLIEREND